jgi:hypothetical protein
VSQSLSIEHGLEVGSGIAAALALAVFARRRKRKQDASRCNTQGGDYKALGGAGELGHPAARGDEGRFTSTFFLAEYDSLAAGDYKHQHQLIGAVHRIIMHFTTLHAATVSKAEATQFFQQLQTEAFQHTDELLNEVAEAAQRMWTSALLLPLGDTANGHEFCSILNAAIREDHPDTARDTSIIVRTINQLLITRRAEASQVAFPPDATCWRGGTLPDQHRAFFQPGTKFRFPVFLATSFYEHTAFEFMYRAHVNRGLPAVRWCIKLDPRGKEQFRYRCKHVSYVTRTNVQGEGEFLFSPYSVFRVTGVREGCRGDDDDPHVIELEAAIDNRKEPADLPLAPWS